MLIHVSNLLIYTTNKLDLLGKMLVDATWNVNSHEEHANNMVIFLLVKRAY